MRRAVLRSKFDQTKQVDGDYQKMISVGERLLHFDQMRKSG
jgi:hypothetical protein